MIENKSDAVVAIFVIAMIVGGAYLYYSTYENYTNKIGIFPEKLGDMKMISFKGGYAAIEEIKGLHGGLPRRIDNAYVVDYTGNSSNKAKFWVTEASNHDDAVSLVNTMSGVVEDSGVYSNRTSVNIGGINVYFVSGLAEHGLYHYFYAKDNRIFWIQIDNSNESYRINFLKESIRRI
jgi:hypothetical protein